MSASCQPNDFIVARFVPRSISRYSNAAAGIVLFAAALDWDVLEKPNRATLIRSHVDRSVVIEVPDNTSLKFSVFRTWIHKIATHAADYVLPLDVVNRICDTAKLSPDHRRVLVELAEESVIKDDEVPDQLPAPAEEPYILTREPYMAHLAHSTTYESAASYKRTWSDGHVDWECVVCGKAFASSKALGGHRQWHIRRGEAEANWQDQVREAARGIDHDWVPTPQQPRTEPAEAPEPQPEPAPPEEEPATAVIDFDADVPGPAAELRRALGVLNSYVEPVLAENEALRAENETLRQANHKIRADLTSLLALIQDLAQDNDQKGNP